VRIIESGYPPILGDTILDKRRYVKEHLDHLRTALMFEPRGHFDMYGVIQVKADLPGADMAVLFMHNEGYSTMCGHATLALGRYAVDKGLVEVSEGQNIVNLETPCGMVQVYVDVKDGKAGTVHFHSVPAFAFKLDAVINTRDYGPVTLDIGYGGAFYAFVSADNFGLDVRTSPTRDLIDVASMITREVKAQIPLSHPHDDDLAFLYGTILTDGQDSYSMDATANICVFADRQVDRSPTGSGVTARIALQHKRKLIKIGQIRQFESITGDIFKAHVLNETTCGPYPAVRVDVSGKAYYIGKNRYSFDADDPLIKGFLLK